MTEIKVGNTPFLDHVFAGGTGERWICSFKGDPGRHRYWKRAEKTHPDRNNFFCVSLLKKDEEGYVRRTASCFRSLHVLVVDDVISKLHPIKVEAKLGVPSYKLETSPNNQQWGYILDPPVTDQREAEGLVNALGRSFTSDMAGVNRLARCPVGVNGKEIYARSGSAPPRTALRYFRPRRLHSPQDLARRLDANPSDYRSKNVKAFLPPERDPVILAIENKTGTRPETTREPGKYRVQCPWIGSHTGGRDDGSVYIAPSGYKCWHGHCVDRTFADFRRYLGLTAEEIDRAIELAEEEEMRRERRKGEA